MNLRSLIKKYRHIIFYLIFGVGTTAVNLITYTVCSHLFKLSTSISTCVAWFVAILFAYFTNRRWVFRSTATKRAQASEFFYFVLCRVATGVLDLVFMQVTVDVFQWNDLIMKLISNFLVIVINYVFSKVLIFKDQESRKRSQS